MASDPLEEDKNSSAGSAEPQKPHDKRSASISSENVDSTDQIPPSVLAISNLRCPSPPPILNTSNRPSLRTPLGSQAASPSLLATTRETVPAGDAVLKRKETETKKEPVAFVTGGSQAPSNESTSSINHILNPPESSAHHKSPSVHAHFYVDETMRPGKVIRSRSGSTNSPERLSATSPLGSTTAPVQSSIDKLAETSTTLSPPPTEQNANIDPRLPQEDGKLHILIGVCGALSTIKVKLIILKLYEIYTPNKISIQLILTKSSENFLPQEVQNYLENTKKIRIWRDEDEWTTWKTRLDPVLHIELRRWADILVVCPLTANTLSKISMGLCDNLLTNVVRAWNTSFPILLAPAMVSYSYNAITTKRQLKLIAEEMPWIEILKPVEKVVGSYGDIGMGGMMDWNEVVNKIVMKLGGYPEEEEEEETADANGSVIVDDDDDDDDDADETGSSSEEKKTSSGSHPDLSDKVGLLKLGS